MWNKIEGSYEVKVVGQVWLSHFLWGDLGPAADPPGRGVLLRVSGLISELPAPPQRLRG